MHCVGEAEIVRGSHAVDEHADLVAAGDRVDYPPGIGGIGLLRQGVSTRLVVEAAVDPAQLVVRDQALQRLFDGVARTEVEDASRRPDCPAGSGRDAVLDLSAQGRYIGHVRKLPTNFGPFYIGG